MGGVDRGDQLIACYNLGRRSKKRVFSYLLETSILNAYHLWKFAWTRERKGIYIKFKLELAEELIDNKGRPRTVPLIIIPSTITRQEEAY